MKKIYSLILFTFINILAYSQLVNYEVEVVAIERNNYSDCTACGAPDPTWMIDLYDNASPGIDDIGIHVPGNTTVYTPVNFPLTNRVNSSATNFVLALDAWEDNCNGDVFNFNPYNFFNCFPSVFGDSRRCTSPNVASVNFRTFAPCVWHSGVTSSCGDYKFTYRFRWSFNEAPAIATQPSPVDNNLCLGTPLNLTATTTLDANGWPTGSNYQWQVSTITDCASAGSSWTNVGGANSANFTPPQTPGTRLYRVLITANCNSNFVSNTTASNCVRVTYNPYGVPGDLPPDIQSGICGSVVLPGSTHPLSALLPPAIGASNGVTYSWTATGGSFSQATGSTTNWTAPVTAGNYVVTLTYEDACGQTDATSTCVVDVGSPNCDFAYVATTGTDDVFAGGPDNPYRTLSYAISQLAGRTYIRMAGGTYNESSIIELQNDLIIEGGYEFAAGIWTKISSQTTSLVLSGFQNNTITGSNNVEHRVGIYGNNDDGFTLQDLTIRTTNVSGTTPSSRGRSNYAILLINGCENYNIIRCDVTSGNASRGANGTTPGNGGGAIGGSGQGGGGSGANGNGNPGGGANGDTGNNAGYNASLHPPYVNPTGANGNGGSGGGGTDNCGGSSGGCPFSSGGCNGNDGDNGDNGANGRSWQVNDRPVTAIPNAAYFVPAGQAGSGQDGGGGGEGAGGNGSRGGRVSCINCDGFNGGSGGDGGRGGRGGSGGYGSGGSFAIFTDNSNVGANISNVLLDIPSSEALGGTGANGSSGINGSNGSGGNCNGCVNGSKCSGDGGRGGRGGDGGRGRDGSNGVNAHLVVDGATSNPSTSIPNFPIVSVNYNNAKACIYSEINLTKDGPNSWSIPLPYVNDLSNSPAPLVTSSYSNGSMDVQVYSTTPGEIVNLQVGGSTFNGYLRIADDIRALPVLTVSPSNINCVNSSVSLSATSWGTEVEYDWRIYQGTDVDNPSLSPSTLVAPNFNLNGLNPGLYTVRYRVREICCGWSIPVYDTIRIIDKPIVFQVQGGGGYCAGSSGAVVTLSGSQNGVVYQLLLNGAPVDTVIGSGAPINFAPQLVPGNYTVIAESLVGCDNVMLGNVNIFIHPNPNDQDLLGDPYVCSAGNNTSTTLVLDDSEIGVNYQLILNDTVPLGIPVPGNGFGISFGSQSNAGQYTVLATRNSTGCFRYLTDTLIVQLISGPTPFNVQGGGAYCAGNQGPAIDLASSENQVDYQLYWNHTVPVGSSVAGNTNALNFGSHILEGDYTIVGTDNLGCESTMIDTLVVDELILPTIQSVTSTPLICAGDTTASISVVASAFNGSLEYALNADTNNVGLFSNLSSGSYFVSVVDDSLCKTVYPFTPIVIAEPAEIEINLVKKFDVKCNGDSDGEIETSITGGLAPYTISWSPTGDTTLLVSNLAAGTYTMTVTDANGCTNSRMFTITQPPALQTSLAPTQPGCPGEQTGLVSVGVNGGVAPYSYVWNTTPNQFGIVATQLFGDNWYAVEVTDFNGCTIVDSVFIQNPDTMTVAVLPGNSSCINGNDGFAYIEVTGGSAPFSYELNGNYQTDSAFNNLTPGNYFIFVEDNKGCVASSQFTITPTTSLDVVLYGSSLSDINATDEIIVVSDEPLQLNATLLNSDTSTQVIEYVWTPLGNLDFSGCITDTLCSDPTGMASESVQIVVEVIELVNGVGCSAFDTLDVVVRTDFPVFFPTAFSPFSDEFKLDCLNDYFEMNVAGAENLDVKIYNRWGELVFSNPNQKNGPNNPSQLDCTNPRNAWDGTFNGEPVPMGAYVYQVEVTYFNGDVETFNGTVTVLR